MTVAFQGIHGANSELAIRQHLGDAIETLPCETLTRLFDAINTNKVKYALLPIENALAGAVAQAYELLMDSDLRIQADVILHVHHALLAPQGVRLKDLKLVRSHPQALAQCEQFLRRHKLQPVAWYDTAGAAHDLAQEAAADGVGALATELAAELYGLDVLESQVEDVPFNFTRFFLLGHDEPDRAEYNKTSIVFATRHHPGALYECLGEFATRGINLTKLESRPRRNRPWEPVFFADFEGHWQDPVCMEALARLLQRASFVKMLGSYPASKTQWVGD
ncbi:MAG: prephenate dehydratase [Anaerolineae bacterium]|nr:prephenate dehydratase [Anaerolineae bacterium]